MDAQVLFIAQELQYSVWNRANSQLQGRTIFNQFCAIPSNRFLNPGNFSTSELW